MRSDYWQEKWRKNEIGFHRAEPNVWLKEHFGALGLAVGSRVFVPLCGKTLDIDWLLERGYYVVGVELVETAVEELFARLELTPAIKLIGKLQHYTAKDISIFVGDIFELSRDLLGAIDAVYDRAALVALPENMRGRYAAEVQELTQRAPQLLVVYTYDQSLAKGPPFSLGDDELKRHYIGSYELSKIASTLASVKGAAAQEKVWLLKPK